MKLNHFTNEIKLQTPKSHRNTHTIKAIEFRNDLQFYLEFYLKFCHCWDLGWDILISKQKKSRKKSFHFLISFPILITFFLSYKKPRKINKKNFNHFISGILRLNLRKPSSKPS